MPDRRISLLLGAAGLAAYAGYAFVLPTEVEFTRPAPAPVPFVDLRPGLSTIYVALPVDLVRVARRAEAALAHRLATGLDAADPSCKSRQPAPECAFGRLDATVTLAAPADVVIDNGIVRVRLPLRIDTGQVSERASVASTAGFSFSVRSAAASLELTRVEDTATEAAFGPNARMVRQVEGRLKPLGLTIMDELRATLAAVPVGAATQRAWSALSEPIELGAGSGLWLKSTPEVAGMGELVATAGGSVQLRVPIATRLTVEAGERPPAAVARRPLVQGQVNLVGGAAIRIATPIRIDGLQDAVAQAFVKGGTIESRADRFGPAVKVDVNRTKLYTSARTLAVELSLTATRYEGQSFRGKAHLVGRPILDRDGGIVSLADIMFPPNVVRESSSPKTVPGAPRLSAEPFANRLATVAKIDVSRDIAEALPRANNLLNQRIDDKLSMAANLTSSAPVGIEVAQDGLWLLSDVTGELVFGYDGPAETGALRSIAERPADGLRAIPGRQLPAPEVAAAAVVGAAAAAAAVPVAKQAAGGSGPPSTAPLPSANASGLVPAASATSDRANAAPATNPTAGRQVKPKRTNRSTVARAPGKGTVQAAKSASWVPFVP